MNEKNREGNFLTTEDMTFQEIRKFLPSSLGVSHDRPEVGFCLAFFEPSTRTRLSFERALEMLECSYHHLRPDESSLSKGESLVDTFENLLHLGIGGAIVRHSIPDVLYEAAERTDMTVINAGAGQDHHPTQALADLYTMQTNFPFQPKSSSERGRRLAIVGDIQHSRVARSNCHLMKPLNIEVGLASDKISHEPEFFPGEDEESFPHDRIFDDLEEALQWADYVMALRMQIERIEKTGPEPGRHYYPDEWKITREKMDDADNPFLMHPGPVIWGNVLAREMRDYEHSLIMDQVKSGIRVRTHLLNQLTYTLP